MSMVEQFFSIKYAGRGELFQGLSVWENEKYRKLQGTYPVVSLSFAAVKEKDYESTVQRINQILTDLYYENSFLLESDRLLPEEKEDFRQISNEMSEVTATMALHRLSRYLHKYIFQCISVL